MNEVFRSVALAVSEAVGTPWAFILAMSVIIVWVLTGPMFGFSDTWQLVVNTGTTIVTFLMVFLIQNTQNRDAKSRSSQTGRAHSWCRRGPNPIGRSREYERRGTGAAARRVPTTTRTDERRSESSHGGFGLRRGERRGRHRASGAGWRKVLLVDDDPLLREAVEAAIGFQWPECHVICAGDGEEGLDLASREEPDVLVLDIGLPGLSGLDVLRRVREASDAPVLMLTARDREEDIVEALEMGADDYLSKPCGSLELIARIKSLLRRAQLVGSPLQDVSVDGLTIRYQNQGVQVNGRSVWPTNVEYRLLFQLVRNAGKVLSKHALLQSAWGSTDYDAVWCAST